MNALILIIPPVDLHEDERQTVRYGLTERDSDLCRTVLNISYRVFLYQLVCGLFLEHDLLNKACVRELRALAIYYYQAHPPVSRLSLYVHEYFK